jgi:ribulose-5-phosphate 4-epimerase/fuculose-1-phosphate aldolase
MANPTRWNTDPKVAPLRAQLAACSRLLHREKILNYSGHISVRLPDRDAFLIQSFTQSRAQVTPDSLVLCDLDANVLEGPAGYKPPIEVFIHSEILRARPDTKAVVHTHSELAAAFTMVEGVEIALMKSHAVRWKSGVPTHTDPSHIKTKRQGQELAATVGGHNAALLRAHGGVLLAESIPALMIDAVHFDENARAHIQATQIGKLKPLTAAELDLLTARSNRADHVEKLWNYYVETGLDEGIIPADWSGLLK